MEDVEEEQAREGTGVCLEERAALVVVVEQVQRLHPGQEIRGNVEPGRQVVLVVRRLIGFGGQEDDPMSSLAAMPAAIFNYGKDNMQDKISFGPATYSFDTIIKMALRVVKSVASFGVTDLDDAAEHCAILGEKLTAEYNCLTPLNLLPAFEARMDRISYAMPELYLSRPACVKACVRVPQSAARNFNEERGLQELSKLLHTFDRLRHDGVPPSDTVELVAWVTCTIRFMSFCREHPRQVRPFTSPERQNKL
ncbi:hypothetical protein [Henriciella pelagia]|uniref:hypothetical protein n=1 Tax=Henriciella pelagia TaxID=1977912 RepID=UPI0035139CE0